MFHFMDDQQPPQDQDVPCGDRLAGRIMAAEYNLAVQRGDQQRANDALGKLLGMFLDRMFR
jgi:hypothetical protein